MLTVRETAYPYSLLGIGYGIIRIPGNLKIFIKLQRQLLFIISKVSVLFSYLFSEECFELL